GSPMAIERPVVVQEPNRLVPSQGAAPPVAGQERGQAAGPPLEVGGGPLEEPGKPQPGTPPHPILWPIQQEPPRAPLQPPGPRPEAPAGGWSDSSPTRN